MIFALTDLVKYRFRLGRYSPEVLAGMGGFLARPEQYASVNPSLKIGDFIFTHPTKSMLAWAIMYVTSGPWSHVGSLTGDGTVWEVATIGVGEYPLRRYFNGQTYISIVRIPLTTAQETQLREFVEKTIGDAYDYRGLYQLFLSIITNAHPHYRLKFAVDILITLGLLALVPFWPLRLVVAVIGGLYLAILGIQSCLRLRAALRLHRDYLELYSPMSNAPRNSTPNNLYRRLVRQPGSLLAEPFEQDDKTSV